jgi:hypothetical protein
MGWAGSNVGPFVLAGGFQTFTEDYTDLPVQQKSVNNFKPHFQ